MTNSIKKITSYVYGAGILANALIYIRNENLKIDHAKQNNIDITVVDYGFYSFGAACAGTVIGRLSVMIVPKYS
jgi:hypothetical protein